VTKGAKASSERTLHAGAPISQRQPALAPSRGPGFYPVRILNPDSRLRAGCYLLRYTWDTPEIDVKHYEGTLRVQHILKDDHEPSGVKYILASGDLYAHPRGESVTTPPELKANPIIIPIFPREAYRFYLCVKSIPFWSISPAGFTMAIESHSYDPKNRLWCPEGQFMAKMQWQLAPEDYPSNTLYATGHVYQHRGEHNGTLTMTWISEYYRRAKLTIHRAPANVSSRKRSILPDDDLVPMPVAKAFQAGSHAAAVVSSTDPAANGPANGSDSDSLKKEWRKHFATLGWELDVDVVDGREVDLSRKSDRRGTSWTEAQIRSVMRQLRENQQQKTDQAPDGLWRYDLVCLPSLLDKVPGLTVYDNEDAAKGHARELATVAADYEFPKATGKNGDVYDYGADAGRPLKSEPDLYFRTAMHEIGHAMGLNHNSAEHGFMMPTDALAHIANQTEKRSFPANAEMSFSFGDLQRLRHWPDVMVRPGTNADANVPPSITIPLFPDAGQDEPIPPKRELAQHVGLHVAPLNGVAQVPLGAPVRIEFQLLPLTPNAEVPKGPSFKSGALTVWVTDPDGKTRGVSPMSNEADADVLVKLARPASQKSKIDPATHLPVSVTGGATLLRGDDGPLFPSPGEYTIDLNVSWWTWYKSAKKRGVEYVVKGVTKVMITPPETANHTDAARKVLNTPELQEVLVRHSALSTCHSSEADALNEALDCPVLQPHFAYLKFRVLADALPVVGGDLKQAFEVLINTNDPDEEPAQDPFLTQPERERVQKLLPSSKSVVDSDPVYAAVKKLLKLK